jgi:hypothetical protein
MPWRGHAFGLQVTCSRPLAGVPAGEAGGDAAGRVAIELVTTADVDAAWGGADARRLFALNFTNGKPYLTIDHAEAIGYRVWAPYHGRHLVSVDGTSIVSAPPSKAGWWWQRLVLAQVLPIAASLQGLDLLHASAVVLNGRAVAITAEAGTGKTTLAAHLLDLDAELLADDVLAVEPGGKELVAHPGAALVNVDPEQRAQLGARARDRLATELGKGDKLYVVGELAARACPLAAVYFLRRDGHGADLRIEREDDARKLLGSSFVPYLDRPDYLVRHLEVCSRIADEVPVFTILAPRSLPADQVAAAVARHGEDAW